MIIRYDVTLDDLAAFNAYHWAKGPRQKVVKLLFYFILGALFILTVINLVLGDLGRFFWYAGLVGFFAALWWYIHSSSFYKSFFKKSQNKGMVGNIELTIETSGIVEKTEVGDSKISWLGVEKIEENSQYIFVYLTALTAFVIPKRSFLNEQAAQEFYSHARTLWDSTRMV